MSDTSLQLDYLKRSYTAVDGLWFVKLEERFGFSTALQLDHEVWQVMAKIQARKAAELLGVPKKGLDALRAALSLKFEAEDYRWAVLAETNEKLTLDITGCPWLEILRQTGRTHLAKTLSESICHPEMSAWAREFGCQMCSSSQFGLCSSGQTCHIVFTNQTGEG